MYIRTVSLILIIISIASCDCTVRYVAEKGEDVINEPNFIMHVIIDEAKYKGGKDLLYVSITTCDELKRKCIGGSIINESIKIKAFVDSSDTLKLLKNENGRFDFDFDDKTNSNTVNILLEYDIDALKGISHVSKSYKLFRYKDCDFNIRVH